VRNAEGRTAAELASGRATRDAFRVARGELGEAWCDWEAAKVGPALTREEVAAREAKEKEDTERQAGKERERRKAEEERIRREEKERVDTQREQSVGKGNALGGGVAGAVPLSGAEKRELEARGLTPEMRQRLERERRARAAEERMRRMGAGG